MLEDYRLTAVITVLAILFYMATAMTVGKMRAKHGVKVPAMTGHPEFERALRVQMNTLESMPIFLPLLWLSTIYFGGILPVIGGSAWIVGRVLFMLGYMKQAEKRELGFIVQFLALIGLLVLTVWGLAT